MTIDKNAIKAFIIDGELERAVKGMLLLTEKYDKYLYNDMILQAGKFSGLKKQMTAGTISQENASLALSNINANLTTLLEKVRPDWTAEIEGDAPTPAQPSSQTPSPSPGKEIILFLAANPKDTSRVRFDEESRRIEGALERSKHRDRFVLIQKLAVQSQDLRRALLDENPTILHFSGHGSEQGQIYLEDASGNGKEISAEALGNLLELFKENLKCILLNACYSDIQASEIVKHGIPVIGMSAALPDNAGLAFSEAFYDALGAGRDIGFAFKLGCSSIEIDNLKAEDIPVLRKP